MPATYHTARKGASISGAPRDLSQELRFGNRRMPEAQVRRRIFEQQRSAQRRLRDVDVAAHDGERLLRQRERQQIAEMNAVHCAPRQVLRHKPGLDACDQIGDASKMPRVETIGAAERHPDPVQADRVARADYVQNAGCDSTAQIILGVHLEPCDPRPRLDERAMVREPQPDSRGGGNHVAFVLPPWILLQSPAGSSTNDCESRAFVASPAHECAPSAQSFLPAALMP